MFNPERVAISFTDVIITFDDVFYFKYKTAPRCQEDFEYKGWFLTSIRSPECAPGAKKLFTLGNSNGLDGKQMACSLNSFWDIQKLACAWNTQVIGHKTKRVYQVCPSCKKIKESYMTLEQMEATGIMKQCGTCEVNVVEYEITYVSSFDGYIAHTKAGNAAYRMSDYVSYGQQIRVHCIRCGTMQANTVGSGSNNYIHKCDNCKPFFSECEECGKERPTASLINYGGELFCKKHVKQDGTCFCCDTENIMVRKKTRKFDGNYHGEVAEYFCSSCLTTPLHTYLGPELSYQFKEEDVVAYHSYKGKPIEIPLGKVKQDPLGIRNLLGLNPMVKNNSSKGVTSLPFMGMEIEMVTKEQFHINKAIKKINDCFTSVWNKALSLCKHDGTISPRGTEIVTKPLTLEAWHEVAKAKVLNTIFEFCSRDETDKNVTGGHIHLNKAAVSKKQLYSMSKFIHENNQFMTLIAGRAFSKDMRWCKAQLAHTPLQMARVGNYKTPDRYVALNVTDHTIEHRYFTTPLCPEDVLKNVEFVHALWAKTQYGYLNGVGDFLSFVEENKKQYPFLNSFVKDNKLHGISFSKNKIVRKQSLDEVECERCRNSSEDYVVRFCCDVEEYRCEDCTTLYRCYDCGDYYAEESNMEEIMEHRVCERCASSSCYITCQCCESTRLHVDNAYFVRGENNSELDVCITCFNDDAIVIGCRDCGVDYIVSAGHTCEECEPELDPLPIMPPTNATPRTSLSEAAGMTVSNPYIADSSVYVNSDIGAPVMSGADVSTWSLIPNINASIAPLRILDVCNCEACREERRINQAY